MTRIKHAASALTLALAWQVETAEQRSHIGSLASQVSRVKRVVNNLQVINH